MSEGIDAGVLTAYSSNVIINGSVFTSNSHLYGGAIFLQGNSNITISNSEFKRNHAFNGGSIYIKGSDDTPLSINLTDSNFSMNIAEDGYNGTGGAIYIENVWKFIFIKKYI